ncbi:hypothetical protein M0P65_05870 [Candidatus Gracilibacteria bacterium]|jgi:hypothetical protein|nr:hypothetical protein [Candidatus Gracilibacteria bacterium]
MINRDDIKNRLALAINWLIRTIDENGRFNYCYDSVTNKKVDDYNILRHAGCCYALWQYHNLNEGIINPFIEVVRRYALKATDYLINTNLFETEEGHSVIVENNSIKTGGIGLSILALLHSAFNFHRDEAHLLVDYILSIQNKNGSLKFHKKIKDKISNFKSDFYDGEVALGLLTYIKNSHILTVVLKKKIENAAIKLINYKYLQSKKTGWTRDHWMVQAIELLDKPTKDQLNFAEQCIIKIIYDPYDLYKYDVFGSIGCRIEALFSYANILEKRIKLQTNKALQKTWIEERKNIIEHAHRFIEVSSKGQIQYGLSMGAWVQNLNSPLVRIDFAQHNISGLIKALQIKE